MTADVNERVRRNAGDLIAVVVAVLLFRLGFQMWAVLVPGSGLLGVVPVLYVYAAAVGLLIAAVTDVSLDDHGTTVALVVLLAVVLGMVGVWLSLPPGRFETDAILFSRYAADLTLQGHNPYQHAMAPAVDRYGADTHLTPTIDGGHVDQVSYPAGAILAFLPQAATGVGQPDLGLTLFVPTVALFALLIWDAPPVAALLPLTLLGAKNFFWAGFGGLLDVLWVLPVVLAMRYWYRQRYVPAAALVGLACATKQHPWFVVPFLAYWLVADSDDLATFGRRALRTGGAGLAAFLVPNLPFLLTAPRAWVDGVLTPVSSATPLVHQGVGLTLLTTAGVVALPTWAYSGLLAVAGVTTLALYALFWDRVKWAAWLAPAVLLYFPHRSLNSYFVYVLPIAVYATFCHLGALRVGPTPAATGADAETEVTHADAA